MVAQTDQPGAYGRFSITAPGVWLYTLNNTLTATNALAAGDAQTETFTVTASINAAATVDVVITITGANDAPILRISAPAANTEVPFGGTIAVSGSATDPDAGQTANLTFAWEALGSFGSFADPAAAETTWSAPLSGTPEGVTLRLRVSDGSLMPTATVIVNLVAVVVTFTGDTTGDVTEGDTSAITGALDVTSNNDNTDVVAQTDFSGTYGLFSILANGEWTYTLGGNDANDEAVNALPGGAEETDTFTVIAEAGGTQDITITITVTGVNDAPTARITAPADGMQVEFDSVVTLTATGADPDAATLTYAWTANPPTGSFADAANPNTTWTVPDGSTDPVVLILTVTDDATPPATATAQVTVNPVGVAVTFGGATTGSVTEDNVHHHHHRHPDPHHHRQQQKRDPPDRPARHLRPVHH